jgi:hypothetical protein
MFVCAGEPLLFPCRCRRIPAPKKGVFVVTNSLIPAFYQWEANELTLPDVFLREALAEASEQGVVRPILKRVIRGNQFHPEPHWGSNNGDTSRTGAAKIR